MCLFAFVCALCGVWWFVYCWYLRLRGWILLFTFNIVFGFSLFVGFGRFVLLFEFDC